MMMMIYLSFKNVICMNTWKNVRLETSLLLNKIEINIRWKLIITEREFLIIKRAREKSNRFCLVSRDLFKRRRRSNSSSFFVCRWQSVWNSKFFLEYHQKKFLQVDKSNWSHHSQLWSYRNQHLMHILYEIVLDNSSMNIVV